MSWLSKEGKAGSATPASPVHGPIAKEASDLPQALHDSKPSPVVFKNNV